MIDQKIIEEQKKVCEKYDADYVESRFDFKVGISSNVKSGILPINGLRHELEDGVTGWYIWAGEDSYSEDPDFFKPLHVEHLKEWAPQVYKFLGLPPGYRFLTDGKHEDVWQDEGLL